MPIPLIIIGAGAIAGTTGIGKSTLAIFKKINANNINDESKKALENSISWIDRQRFLCSKGLTELGELKINILNESIKKFVDSFSQIKNIDFKECENLDELNNCHLDSEELKELKKDVDFIIPMIGGTAAGVTSGAIVAFGAYGAAQAFATASTGTAISALSGAAASNATLAFFGGGSLAAGGLGVAGGTIVLGSIVAAPTLLIMGVVADINAKKDLENARINQENIKQTVAELSIAGLRCQQIRRRVYIYENLLVSLDSKFLPLVLKMEDIIKNEGYDYRDYSKESKKIIASTASLAVSIKAVLDKTVLDSEGNLINEED